jgi:hypothetical protein
MSFDLLGPPLAAAAAAPLAGDLFLCDFRSLDVDPDTGTLTLPTGHVGTWSRNATLASVSDANGVTYTALDGQMAWEQRDWDNDGTREAFGLRMGTSDRLAFPAALRFVAMAGLLEIIETGARTTAGATLLAYQVDAGTGAGFWLDTSGSFYRFNYSDGTTTRTATIASGAPVSGDRVVFTWQLTSAGALTFKQSINGAAATTATAAALTLPSAPLTGGSLRLNSRGTSANPGQGWYRRAKLVAGALDDVTILERW